MDSKPLFAYDASNSPDEGFVFGDSPVQPISASVSRPGLWNPLPQTTRSGAQFLRHKDLKDPMAGNRAGSQPQGVHNLLVDTETNAILFATYLPKPSIFLDWFGVLADNDLMTRQWRRVEARILFDKYGGRVSKWMSAHDRAFRWYLNYWARHGPNRGSYRVLWKHGEIEWVRRTLKWGGVKPPKSERELFRLDRDLTYEVTHRIDPAYPYARHVLQKLRRDFRLFLVSGADSGYIKGAMEATGMGTFFERTFSPDTLDSFKGTMVYWMKILRLSGSDPAISAVVDDKPRFLRVPSKLGLTTILVNRNKPTDRQFATVRTVKELVTSDVLSSLAAFQNHGRTCILEG